ncbi:Cytochrome c554 [Chlorella sorokiniana]|uniref:Cytochrome c554 n=1 Tax=Chlorella sorokiniana TaxID=3076 RepID=A0A2P6U413_CHLSO|nr:Cytochrome c554 [Chlorella sorokiniana]|eukprot:PRW61051.1 Cytochrome c554 [Chlorella sorokiniana]
MRTGRRVQQTTALVAATLALLVAVAPAAAVPHATVHAGSAADFAAMAHSLDAGGRLTVTGYRLEGEDGEATLLLKHHQVWAPGAKVVVHTAEGTTEEPPPSARIFRGTIDGAPDSSVLLSVHEDGRMTGMAMRAGASWALGHEEEGLAHDSDGGSSMPAGRRRLLSLGSRRARLQETEEQDQAAEAPKPKSRRCGNRPGHSHGPERHQPDASAFLQNAARKLAQSTVVIDTPLQCSLAIDSDAEFYALFGNKDDATNYVALLVGYADVVYSREIGVDLVLGHLELRPDKNAGGYPYRSLPDAEVGLTALQNYWNKNRQDIKRCTAHLLSGKKDVDWVGMAWEGVLCGWYDSKGNNWAYGFTSNLEGDFTWSGVQGKNPKAVSWDVFNFAHEVGHNFGAIHAFDYCGKDGWGDNTPVDYCKKSDNGCSQPNGYGFVPKCSSTPTAFGGGGGTIMSYCDEIGPGYIKNVAMTFGKNHPCGHKPERIANSMIAHVTKVSKQYPQCFQPNPAAAGVGTWTSPIAIPSIPFTSPTVSTFEDGSNVPGHCNDAATPFDYAGRPVRRAVKVYRWTSPSDAGGRLTIGSCGAAITGRPAVSIRSTINPSANPLTGPWQCEGWAESGCSSGNGFKLSVTLRPNTVYVFVIVGMDIPPTLRFGITWAKSPVAPLAAPQGAWSNARTIQGLPFTSPAFNAFYKNTVPTDCNDLAVNTLSDGITQSTGPTRVFRVWFGTQAAGRSLTVSSCDSPDQSGDTHVSIRATSNQSNPLAGPWICVRSATDGCPTGSGFRVTVPVQSNSWHYIIVGYAGSGPAPATKLTVALS